MAIVSYDRRYLFIMVPRTGCTAIGEGVLIPRCSGAWLPAEDVLDAAGRITVDRKHCYVNQLTSAGLLPESDRRRLFTFGATRNPFDSLVSLYVKQRSTYVPLQDDDESWVNRKPRYAQRMAFAATHDFDEWLEFVMTPRRQRQRQRRRRLHLSVLGRRRAFASMPDGHFFEGLDRIMRFESLADDFADVAERLDLHDAAIPRVNVTEARGEASYRDFYSSDSRALVEDVYETQLQHFGYAF